VAGCTCNGKDQLGLAPVKIEDDPTLRKGDIVAGEGRTAVATAHRKARRLAGIFRQPRTRCARAINASPVWLGIIIANALMAGLSSRP